ncbi:hypothetical protein ACHAXS_013290 [Conticribra weissflogii]
MTTRQYSAEYCSPRRKRLPFYIWTGLVSVFVLFQGRLNSTTTTTTIANNVVATGVASSFTNTANAPAEEPIPLRANTDGSAAMSQSRVGVAGNGDDGDGRTTLAGEIQYVRHLPGEGTIVVQFNHRSDSDHGGGVGAIGSAGGDAPRRSCRNPFLAGRLSGPFLSHNFRWEKIYSDLDIEGENRKGGHGDNETTRIVDKMIWRYEVPAPGRYHVEILGILCNDVGFHENNGVFKNACLEESESLRITHQNASIHVIRNSIPGEGRRGFWKWEKSPSDIYGVANIDATTTPLLTRYQPVGCRGVDSKFCNDRVSTDRFVPYKFHFFHEDDDFYDDAKKPNSQTQRQRQNLGLNHQSSYQHRNYQTLLSTYDKELRVMNKLRSTTNHKIKLCFVGASHSRKMTQAFNQLFVDSRTTDFIEAYHLDVKFPRSVDIDFIRGNILRWNCAKTIIAIGQWAASATKNEKYSHIPPISFPDFRDEHRTMMKALNYLNVSGVHLRSIHLNPLGDLRLKCPAEDYRHPSVLGVYNEIIRNLTKLDEFRNIPFIDTDFIIGPMWDSSPDFCHFPPEGEIARAEALYILENVLFEDANRNMGKVR